MSRGYIPTRTYIPPISGTMLKAGASCKKPLGIDPVFRGTVFAPGREGSESAADATTRLNSSGVFITLGSSNSAPGISLEETQFTER